eukprot:5652491-Pyramimonas_sp.AAC.1
MSATDSKTLAQSLQVCGKSDACMPGYGRCAARKLDSMVLSGYVVPVSCSFSRGHSQQSHACPQ